MKHFCQECKRVFKASEGRLVCDSCLLERQKELKIKMSEEELNRKKAEEHFLLVQRLKECLVTGQASFLLAGGVLHQIKSQETYKTEDFSREITWEEFLTRPDLPFPTSSKNPESIRRMADRLVDVYQTFVERFEYKEEDLALIGFSKLSLINPVVKGLDKKDNVVPQWIKKAEMLSVRDLIAEIKTKDKTLEQILDCRHTNASEIKKFYCPDCACYFKDDPRPKEV